MKYFSSRGISSPVSAAQAITIGIASDGGLFVPETVPQLKPGDLENMKSWNYGRRAVFILQQYLDDFSLEEIELCVNNAYNNSRFDHEEIAPLVKLEPGLFIQELWHGPTLAFKDMALQILPHLLTASMKITGVTEDIVILVATSGDTGKAALEGFKDVGRTRVIVFYPQEGVSVVQKRQMITQEGNNVYVAAVAGNFDDAQAGVKRIFADSDFAAHLQAEGLKLSSANSINWGRLVPQIIYYISAYIDLLSNEEIKPGEKVNIVVPTGNFGNILAAYYAGKMGLPVNRLICASNANNVLTEFINTGRYDRNREFHKTISPSMDILISSNLERLLYEVTDHDANRVRRWMQELAEQGYYQIDDSTASDIRQIFQADYCSDEDTLDTIRQTWKQYRYLPDTHTAVALNVNEKYRNATGDKSVAIVASTASPFKFGSSVARAVLSPAMSDGKPEFELLRLLSSATGIQIPTAIRDLEKLPVIHNILTSAGEMPETIARFLNLNKLSK
ncbi:MAG: threonine synthase [Syntrophomonadaceae bacterium]